ncbi:2-phosphosulfolactate phosphatase [Plebeiibacterium sediminum]|uniref:Probable 2-phosphosulfolactate phosphatase n=1 Tax=Plebeiibacterium sediminum TaxID=2992112 RepID=A0AAE3M678_9BACT|nr:2-phosphosulfolactate phosphatase [Plebeiobacterium sediminum]MCW3787838.1 2-phosphosulfolactate phosphatase [Plebeiobacterium sediminum]
MKVDIISSAREIFPDRVEGKVVVVIDILRATSVMVTAFANGAKSVVPVMTPEEAFEIKEQLSADQVVLGGEREAMPIAGFDYGNSPLSYVPEVIKNKSLVITTTNGTRAILNSQKAVKLYIGAFINDKAIVDVLKGEKEVVLVASGSYDEFTIEDSLCAGKLAYDLQKQYGAELTDVSIAMSNLYRLNCDDIHKLVSQGAHYKRLKSMGFFKDLDYCFKSDLFQVVPEYKNGTIQLKSLVS